MTRITNKKMFFMFGRKGVSMLQSMNNTFLEHQMLCQSGAFRYRAPQANRPTPPRKRFIG